MSCNFHGLQFGLKSQNAFEEINRVNRNAKRLGAIMAGSVIMNIFFNNRPLFSAYAISQYDFTLFAQAMRSIDPIIRKRIMQISSGLIEESSVSYQERQFWRCIYDAA